MQNKYIQNAAIFVLTAYILAASAGMVMAHTDAMGHLNTCPFSVTQALCPFNVSDHLQGFLNSFAALPFMVVMVLFTYFIFAFKSDTHDLTGRFSFVSRKNLDINQSVFNKFLVSLSDGVIQPKIYS